MPKLIYFDFYARAEPIRMALHYCDIPFENALVAFKDWPEYKK